MARGPFDFILDTGAGTTILTPELGTAARSEKHRLERRSDRGRQSFSPARERAVDRAGIGATRRSRRRYHRSQSHLERAVGAKIDGDLGYNFLKHFRLTIDFAILSWPISQPRHAAEFPSAVAEVKFRLAAPAKPLILVQAHLNGRGPFQFAIDTGTSTTAISPQLAQ